MKISRAKDYLNKVVKKPVLVIGETMIDRYIYGKRMSQFRVECLLEFMESYKEESIGGAGLVANNVSNFVKCVDFVTLTNKSYGDIKSKLNDNINFIPIVMYDYPTPIKTRYVDEVNNRYYFKSTHMNDNPISPSVVDEIQRKIDAHDYEIIIVIDKGHGMLTPELIRRVVNRQYSFISVNCQANSENCGYIDISKYGRVNLLTLNEREIRSILMDKHSHPYQMINKISELIDFQRIILTLSNKGCIISDKNTSININEQYNKNVVDSIGAGDALQTIASLMSYANAPLDLIGHVSNIAGAEVCKTSGTKNGLSKEALYEMIDKYDMDI